MVAWVEDQKVINRNELEVSNPLDRSGSYLIAKSQGKLELIKEILDFERLASNINTSKSQSEDEEI